VLAVLDGRLWHKDGGTGEYDMKFDFQRSFCSDDQALFKEGFNLILLFAKTRYTFY